MGILRQIELYRAHPMAARIASAGGIVPLLGWWHAHVILADVPWLTWWREPIAYALLFCLTYSVRSVWTWGRGFGDWCKALSLVFALELTMVFGDRLTGLLALATLIAINAVSTACTLIERDRQSAAGLAASLERANRPSPSAAAEPPKRLRARQVPA